MPRKCETCSDVAWVCEAHSTRPWDDSMKHGCTCDAGIPCPDCNFSPDRDTVPRMPPGFDVIADDTGDKRH